MPKDPQLRAQTLTLALLVSCLFARPLHSDVLTGPITNSINGNIYYLLAQNTWPASEAEAIELGGHLATIEDQAENDWVFSTFAAFGGQPRCLWIGYHRQQTHGAFSWADGSSSTFTNWSTGEPNDHFYGGEPEDFVFMWDPSRTESFRMPGTWNDVPDITTMDTIQICGVVEITRPRLTIRREPNGIEVGWSSRTNKVYQLEYRTSLAATNSWIPFGAPIAGNGLTNRAVDPDSSQRERYYRVRELP
ncbi:MAG TPA: C-type lectin domain-containing protein [Methylomirabilota bacterium]|nr:C-type lectin domain-containing protein [Methylomirabilota bacterium]